MLTAFSFSKYGPSQVTTGSTYAVASLVSLQDALKAGKAMLDAKLAPNPPKLTGRLLCIQLASITLILRIFVRAFHRMVLCLDCRCRRICS